jgi:hypothetical protein
MSRTTKESQNINLKVCRKLDSKVTKVVATATHVVMYILSNGSEWVRLPARCFATRTGHARSRGPPDAEIDGRGGLPFHREEVAGSLPSHDRDEPAEHGEYV